MRICAKHADHICQVNIRRRTALQTSIYVYAENKTFHYPDTWYSNELCDEGVFWQYFPLYSMFFLISLLLRNTA